MDPDPKLRIAFLEAALQRERERTAAALRRCELLEASCKNAYRLTFGIRPAREHTTKDTTE
jgi:hypothetical protein